MSSLHNYINPAFCQQSEFYGNNSAGPIVVGHHHAIPPTHPHNRVSNNNRGDARVHRSLSMRSMGTRTRLQQYQAPAHPDSEPRRTAPPPRAHKPSQVNLSARYETAATAMQNIANNNAPPPLQQHQRHHHPEGFALVPLSELPNRDQIGSRYAYVPAQQAQLMQQRSVSQRRLARSQDGLDRYNSDSHHGSRSDVRDSSFTSLPPQPTTTPMQNQQHHHAHPAGGRHHRATAAPRQMHTSTRNNSVSSMANRSPAGGGASTIGNQSLRSAFSTDFVANRSLVLVDQKSQQRYAIVPTAEDEELVDANEEIIQMHNGRAHRYAVIPTTATDDDDDDDVDADRLDAADDDEEQAETCLSSGDFEMSPDQSKYSTIKCAPPGFHQSQMSLQQLHQQQQHQRPVMSTPSKISNHVPAQNLQQNEATQKLFEILSTPRKPASLPQQQQSQAIAVHQQQPNHHHLQHQSQLYNPHTNGTLLRTPTQRQPHYEASPGVTPTHHHHQQQRNQPQHYQSTHTVHTSTPKHAHGQSDFTPQTLYYDRPAHHQPQPPPMSLQKHPSNRKPVTERTDQRRTTAVITPRLSRQNRVAVAAEEAEDSDDPESMMDGKSMGNVESNVSAKLRRATATIGAVSLMLMLCGAMNSSLCLYMISVFGRLYYLDLGILTGFAAVSLGALGFRSRHSEWLPNRNYVSGYTLVTIFTLLNCCGLLVLLATRPPPGTPLHDVTTGVILGLSSLTLLVISLGVITSRWCRGPPPDNRVEVYNATY